MQPDSLRRYPRATSIVIAASLLIGCVPLNSSLETSSATREVYNLNLNNFNIYNPFYTRTRNILWDFYTTNPNNYLVLTDDPAVVPGKAGMLDQTEERRVFDQLASIDQYFRTVHNRNGLDNQGAPIRAVLESGGGPLASGAFWLGRVIPDPDIMDPMTRLLRAFGSNAHPQGHIYLDHRRLPFTPREKLNTAHYYARDYVAPGDSVEILTHEFVHGISVNEDKFAWLSCFEVGAASESFADIFGVMLGQDWIVGNDHLPVGQAHAFSRNLQDPHLSALECSHYYNLQLKAEDSTATTSCAALKPGTTVTEDNSLHQPKHINEYNTSTSCQGNVHSNAGILNYAAYLISQGGSYINDAGQTINFPGIDRPSAQGALDREQLAKLYYAALTGVHLPKYPDFQAVRRAVITSAEDIFGATEDWKVQTARHAFSAVGIGEGLPPVPPVNGTRLVGTPTASSYAGTGYVENAVDGDPQTSWEPIIGTTSWLQLDLGDIHALGVARIRWMVNAELYLVSSYRIIVSADGQNWQEADTGGRVVNEYGGVALRDHDLKGHHARFIRIQKIIPYFPLGTMHIAEVEIYSP